MGKYGKLSLNCYLNLVDTNLRYFPYLLHIKCKSVVYSVYDAPVMLKQYLYLYIKHTPSLKGQYISTFSYGESSYSLTDVRHSLNSCIPLKHLRCGYFESQIVVFNISTKIKPFFYFYVE